MIKGTPASPGSVIGKVLVWATESLEISRRYITPDEIQTELASLDEAIQLSKVQLMHILDKAAREVGFEEAKIFQAQSLILDDYLLLNTVTNHVAEDRINVEAAVDKAIHMFVTMMEAAPDEYTRERAFDILDVGRRLIRNLQGREDRPAQPLGEPSILMAYDLTPSDTINLDKTMVLGLATQVGGRTSHTAILARSLGIPAVVGLGPELSKVETGTTVILDGDAGQILLNPSPDLVEVYKQRYLEEERKQARLTKLRDLPAVTSDGFRVILTGNIGTLDEVKKVLEAGAEGIGLFRTEFLFMDRSELPSEEEQFQIYKEVTEAAGGKPVNIRTLDIGGDKPLPYLRVKQEVNPSMGCRGVRLCLEEKEMFITQMRAILRASAFGKVRMTFPMVSGLEDLLAAKQLFSQARDQLSTEGVLYDPGMEIGIMIEVPSAALMADHLIKEVDFFSLGTNDLTQYTIAVDRMNEKVAELYQPFNPAVLKLIKLVVEASHRDGKWTGMCGEMAGDLLAVPLLLGLGLDELSMIPGSLPQIKQTLRRSTKKEGEELVTRILKVGTVEQVIEILS